MLYRFHLLEHEQQALYYGRSRRNRFASPNGQYGLMHAGSDERVAFVEVFGRDVTEQFVTTAEIERRCLTHVQVLSDLRLVDLTGAHLRELGADARLTTGDHAVTRTWGLALWQHPHRADGLAWHSRFDDERLVLGLFDRASSKVGWQCQGSLVLPEHRQLLGAILDTYSFGLL